MNGLNERRLIYKLRCFEKATPVLRPEIKPKTTTYLSLNKNFHSVTFFLNVACSKEISS